MAQQMGDMDDTPRYEDVDMEWLYSHSEADVGDSRTHGLDDPHSGTGATQGEQFEDPATRVLRDKDIRTISIQPDGSTTFHVTLAARNPLTREINYIKTHRKLDESYPNDVVKERCERILELMANDMAASSSVTEGTVLWCLNDAFSQAFENKPEYTSRNIGDSSASHMAKGIRKLEAENCHQQTQIEELTTQMATKESIYEAHFWRLEALLLLGSSSSSVFEVAHLNEVYCRYCRLDAHYDVVQLD
ncbi:hypothetical protein FH972_017602 [Carpinus fangiana]|uniref:Uncharacterized protein n=1 Tax=Carpinus fangiana TaxID=176857 RepID=A0A5N6RME3_9ROSI|nr:hypothetical protein FH972_017602 [Carpinus fangiana]